MNIASAFSAAVLTMDPSKEIAGIEGAIREMVFKRLRRKGVVVGLSGGIDSSVAAALCARALGKDRILGLLMPEVESSPESLELGHLITKSLGIEPIVEDITSILNAAGCYQRRDQAIQGIIPEYGNGYKCKMSLYTPFDREAFRVFSIVVRSPEGREIKARLTLDAYQGIVAATNFKQRARKMMEYYHADRLNYAVVGTPNRLEHDQGFFVKNGDGSADLKPIAHLYKTQQY